MTLLGFVGILLGLLGARFACIEWTRLRIGVFAFTYLFHLVTTFAYYRFSQANLTDAGGYYYDYINFYEDVGFGMGTLFITYIVQSMKHAVGGTFLDYFFLFQTISFFGICLLMRMIEEIYREVEVEQPLYIYALPLLPGLHFWTSAIGKDGFLLLAVCMTIWAVMNLKKRYLALVAGVVIMVVIRPHIAALTAASLGGTFLLDRGTKLSTRSFVIAVSIVGLAFALSSVRQMTSVDVRDADSVSDFLAAHEEVTQDAEVAGNSAVYGNYPFRLMSLLFRPMFIDADNIMGLAASVENLLLLMLMATVLARLRTAAMLVRRLRYMRFALFLGTLIALLLALVYYNIGLGLRQKTMFVPPFIIIFVTVMAFGRARRLLPQRRAAAAMAAPHAPQEALPARP